GPPAVSYRLRKFARRHRWPLATAAGFLILLVGGVIGLINRNMKIQKSFIAEKAAKAQTQEALDLTTDEVIQELLAQPAQLSPAQRQFLRPLQEHYERFIAEAEDTPAAREKAVKWHSNLARIRYLMDEMPEAMAGWNRAISLGEKLTADYPAEPQYREELA